MVVSADNRGISVDPDRVKRKIGLKLFTLEQIIVLPWRFLYCQPSTYHSTGNNFHQQTGPGWFCIPGIQCVLILDYRVIHVLLLSSNLTVCGVFECTAGLFRWAFLLCCRRWGSQSIRAEKKDDAMTAVAIKCFIYSPSVLLGICGQHIALILCCCFNISGRRQPYRTTYWIRISKVTVKSILSQHRRPLFMPENMNRPHHARKTRSCSPEKLPGHDSR